MTELEVLADAEAVAARAVERIVSAAADAIAARGVFHLAVSGGTTPRRMLELLAVADGVDWTRVCLYQVDERVAPDGATERNATMLDEALLTEAFSARTEFAGLRLMPVTAGDLAAAAASYAAALPESLDLVQLGLGDDGHTASLVPGDAVLQETDRDVALTAPYRGTRRMTLTIPLLRRARAQLWVVTGVGKRDALARLQAVDPGIPGSHVVTDRAVVLADRDAVPVAS